MIALTLYWKHNGKDDQLGTGLFPHLPPPGTLLTFACEQGMGWRVIHPYIHLIREGSMTHQSWMRGNRADTERADLFVEPAEGPREP